MSTEVSSGVLKVLFDCCMADTTLNCGHLGAHCVYTIQPYTCVQCPFTGSCFYVSHDVGLGRRMISDDLGVGRMVVSDDSGLRRVISDGGFRRVVSDDGGF